MNATNECKSTPEEIRVGDVWQSDPAGRKSQVKGVYGRDHLRSAYCKVTLLATGAEKTLSLTSLRKGRKLVERGGVRVGETRVDGAVTYRVLSISGDDAHVEGPTGLGTRSLVALAVLPLPEEPSKAKARPAAEVPQKGDVWGSAGGRNRVEVTEVTAGHWPSVRWVSKDVHAAGSPTAYMSGACHLKRFARGRILLERDGKPVRRIVPTTLREQVAEFHAAFGVPTLSFPSTPPEERVRLRARIIAEQFCKTMEAMLAMPHSMGLIREDLRVVIDSGADVAVNLPAFADALADLDYVVEGTRLEFGINGAPIAAAVHAANMTKLGPDGKPVFREDGKVLKPEGWQPANIAVELRKQGWEG